MTLDNFIDEIRGTANDIILYFNQCFDREPTIEECEYIDRHVFTCERCSWTLDIAEMSEYEDELICTQCEEEE